GSSSEEFGEDLVSAIVVLDPVSPKVEQLATDKFPFNPLTAKFDEVFFLRVQEVVDSYLKPYRGDKPRIAELRVCLMERCDATKQKELAPLVTIDYSTTNGSHILAEMKMRREGCGSSGSSASTFSTCNGLAELLEQNPITCNQGKPMTATSACEALSNLRLLIG
ncbi:unnamed protein product, partial [Amoebophrya sp. A25]